MKGNDNIEFRGELLREDIVPRNLNDVSKKYKNLLLDDIEQKKINLKKIERCQCGSSQLEELTRIDRFGLPFGTSLCKECGLVSTNPIIDEQSLEYYYSKYYHPLNYGKEGLEKTDVLYGKGQGSKIFSILENYLPKRQILSVLEIGAGTGNVLKEFKSKADSLGLEVVELGTEYSQDCIEKCKDNGVNTIFGNVDSVIKLDKKFDVIILSHVFEHFVDLDSELDKIKTIMKEDGLLYIEVPGILDIHKKGYYDYSFLGYTVHAHIYNFTLGSLERILVKNGFEKLFGNEIVESVFRVSKGSLSSNIENPYSKVIHYLEFINDNKNYFKDVHEQYRIEKDIAEKRALQVLNREKEIDKLAQQVSNRNKDIEKYLNQIENRNDRISYLLECIDKSKGNSCCVFNYNRYVNKNWLYKLMKKINDRVFKGRG